MAGPDNLARPVQPAAVSATPCCLNCSEEAPGRFCSACGQPTRLPATTFRAFVADWLRGFFKVDGKTLGSLRALFTRPGFLSREFWEGRRVRYTEPRRLYFFASLVFFGVYAVVPARSAIEVKIDTPTVTVTDQIPWLARRAVSLAKLPPAELLSRTKAVVQSEMPKISFALLPFFAFLLLGMFRAGRRSYLEHLTFAFHVHSFGFLAMVPGLVVKPLQLLCFVAIGVYTLLAMWRAYQLSFWGTLARYLAIYAVYSLVVLLSLLALILVKV